MTCREGQPLGFTVGDPRTRGTRLKGVNEILGTEDVLSTHIKFEQISVYTLTINKHSMFKLYKDEEKMILKLHLTFNGLGWRFVYLPTCFTFTTT